MEDGIERDLPQDGGESRKPPSERVKLSSLSKEPVLSGVSERGRLQRDAITPALRFFAWANLGVGTVIVAFALMEHFFPSASKTNIITDRVVIAVVGGISLQASAVVITAFKGLFK